ncbi:hypothetical protein TNCT_573551 [Trichonephila clavata]|uniref:Uncharacterized protein n=1 Tax=Trichonephila clavata TaxID=2740835 RepID=A0A8X6HLQ4_TRICU|nr:hypothetical protein TNCT_573551 [Trichonephila clavata]
MVIPMGLQPNTIYNQNTLGYALCFMAESCEGEFEEVKSQSSGAIRMLKTRKAVESDIKKHNPNMSMAKNAANLSNDNAVLHFH